MSLRSFISIDCKNEEIIRKFIDIQRKLERTGAELKLVEPENIHMTLKFLGEINIQKVEEISIIFEEIKFTSFNIKLEGVGVFPHLRRINIIWVGVTEGITPLIKLFQKIDNKMINIGFKKERKRFHPHFTICRVRSGRNREQLIQELNMLKDDSFGVIKVDKIFLKKSQLTPKGPIYSTLLELE
jgi:2'-5' RNA ligase